MRKISSVAAGLAGVALAAVVAAPANAIVGGEVVGGEAATKSSPNVALTAPGTACSGTLLNTQWVLTAAACFDQGTTGIVAFGGTTWARSGEDPYSEVVREDGLALVKLDVEILPEAISMGFPVLGDADPAIGSRVQFFGAGTTVGPKISSELRFGFANVVTPSENGRADGFNGPSWTTLSDGNGISGDGDWGGGAYLDGKLVGVSVGKNGEEGTNFASVAAHRTFITRTLAGTRPEPRP